MGVWRIVRADEQTKSNCPRPTPNNTEHLVPSLASSLVSPQAGCAVTGILVLALPIPIFVSNFQELFEEYNRAWKGAVNLE